MNVSCSKKKLEKRKTFTNDILFVDGLWGTGKSLLSSIVSGMDRVEKVKVESIYEYISWMFHLGKIDKDGAIWMLRTYADCSQYHNTIGREVNLRWSDDTGLKCVPDKIGFIRRLFAAEGDFKVDIINRDNLAFCVMSHLLMLTPELLHDAYGDRVKVLEVVRHPLYLVKHFSNYLSRFDSSREFTMAFYHEEQKIPWFAMGWERDFANSKSTEKAVLCITRLYSWLREKIQISRTQGLAILDVSFEECIFDTESVLNKLETFLGRRHHARIKKILKKQKLPRTTIMDGKGHSSYGWAKSNKSEEQVYQEQLAAIQASCSSELQHDMKQLISWYNNNYPSKLAKFE